MAVDLVQLFNHYVDRNFATAKEYQETLMTERVTELFRAKNLLTRYKSIQVGNEDYHVTLPLVALIDGDPRPARALKPLNLMQTDATQIRNHGDKWRTRVDRLQNMNFLPREMLFAVQYPPETNRKCFAAAKEICDLLLEKGVEIAPIENSECITEFAAKD